MQRPRFGNRANPQAKDELGIGLQTKPARDISCRPTNFDDSLTDCYFKVQNNLLTKIMPSAQVSLRQITITTMQLAFFLSSLNSESGSETACKRSSWFTKKMARTVVVTMHPVCPGYAQFFAHLAGALSCSC